jgi:hypothetical protein
MFAKNVLGNGSEAIFPMAFSDTTPQDTGPQGHGSLDSLSLQLIVDYQVDQETVTNTDNVVASTTTFTFADITFTGLVGATINVSGATNAGNNGSFVISSVTSAHVVVCTTASGLVNETFDPTRVTVTVTHTETAAKPQGAWTVLVSNTFVESATGPTYNAPPSAGRWTDVTALFDEPAAIAGVTDAGSQYVQAPLHARHFKVIWAPSSGKGVATAAIFGKSWST